MPSPFTSPPSQTLQNQDLPVPLVGKGILPSWFPLWHSRRDERKQEFLDAHTSDESWLAERDKKGAYRAAADTVVHIQISAGTLTRRKTLDIYSPALWPYFLHL